MLAERALAPLTDVFLFESACIAGRFDARVGARNGVRRVVADGISPAELHAGALPTPTPPTCSMSANCARPKASTRCSKRSPASATPRPDPARGAGRLRSGPGGVDGLAQRLGIGAFVLLPRPVAGPRSFKLGRVLVVPSRAESMPYIVLEAAGARVPMIATDVGGIPEIFGPYRDRLGPANDPADLPARIEAALATPEAERRARAARLAALSPSASRSRRW